LEYAEERGLSTGVVTNVEVADATPAACYAHVNDRKKWGEIFLQIFSPRYGDGVDIAFGAGRQAIYDAVRKSGKDLDAIAEQHHRPVYASLNDVPADATRALAVVDGEMDVPAAARRAIQALSKTKKGYFLIVEWDAHTDEPEKGLSHVVAFDKLIRELSGIVNADDTLLLYTADHSFDFRIHGGGPDRPLLTGLEDWQKQHTGQSKETIRLPYVRVDDTHTGEEVLATGKGPGAESIHGYFPNTYAKEHTADSLCGGPALRSRTELSHLSNAAGNETSPLKTSTSSLGCKPVGRMFASRPGTSAFVFGVMAASILDGSMQCVLGSESTKTAVAFAIQMASAVAKNVLVVVTHSSPGPIPRARNVSHKASVPLATPTAYFIP
jgi:hypothetical protein